MSQPDPTTAPAAPGASAPTPEGGLPPVPAPGGDGQPAGQPDSANGELTALKARLDALEKRNESRPPSSVEQLQSLIAEATGVRHEAVTTKTDARDVADTADAQVKALGRELRAMKISAAAKDAGMANPDYVGSSHADVEGDPEQIVKGLLETGAFALADKKPTTTTPDVSGGGITSTGDKGIDDLAKEIAASRQ